MIGRVINQEIIFSLYQVNSSGKFGRGSESIEGTRRNKDHIFQSPCVAKNVTGLVRVHAAGAFANNVPLMETDEALNSGGRFLETFGGFRRHGLAIVLEQLKRFNLNYVVRRCFVFGRG